MKRHARRAGLCLVFLSAQLGAQAPDAAQTLSWQDTEARFKANNPALLAGQLTINESKADEVTAYLRPNPNLNLFVDQFTPYRGDHGFRPIWQVYPSASIDYLHERQHKRELRLEDAEQATAEASSTQNDLARNLLFNLRDAFVRVLLAKAVFGVAQANLSYYDKEIQINQDRFNAGQIAHVDFERVELQRVQFATDVQTADVNLRTAKIDLLALLKQRTPVDKFDVREAFEFVEPVSQLADLRRIALDSRPDLKEAQQSVIKARTDHQLAVANGSTDPTFSVNGSRQAPPIDTYFGVGMSIPLRIFDRNQGEKARTLIDIARNQRLLDQAETTALHDVDSAYATLESTVQLIRPYKEKYLKEAEDIRDTVAFSYGHGSATLLDFLDAQREYRDTELDYLSLVGAYFSAANQVNFSVGREVIR